MTVSNANTWWLQVGVESSIGWPTEELEIEYEGNTLYLSPAPESKCAPTIAVKCNALAGNYDLEYSLICRFLSALCWSKNGYVRTGLSTAGPNRIRIGIPVGLMSIMEKRHFTTHDIPVAINADSKIALALYREGAGSENIFYQALSFAKVFNIKMTGKQQVSWINSSYGKVIGIEPKDRINELLKNGNDIGQYIYVSCRCAIAHAHNNPLVDPDNPKDLVRLMSDTPLIKELVEIYIENDLGIKSRKTIYREHAYELGGFTSILGGPENVAKTLQTTGPVSIDLQSLPPISIGLERHDAFPVFQSMKFHSFEVVDSNSMKVAIRGHGDLVEAIVVLEYDKKRLVFEPWNGMVAVMDDGSEKAAELAASLYEFNTAYLANGCLEIVDLATRTQIARKDAYVGLNIDLSGTIRKWSGLIEKFRRMASERQSK